MEATYTPWEVDSGTKQYNSYYVGMIMIRTQKMVLDLNYKNSSNWGVKKLVVQTLNSAGDHSRDQDLFYTVCVLLLAASVAQRKTICANNST